VTVSDGKAQVTVACKGTGAEVCKPTVTLSVVETLSGTKIVAVAAYAKSKKARKPKATRKTVTIGSGSATISAGKSKVIALSLDAKGRALLKARVKLVAKLVVTAVAGSGKKITLESKNIAFRETKHG
jgi:hypothetical protein